jgi:hypothetical protein
MLQKVEKQYNSTYTKNSRGWKEILVNSVIEEEEEGLQCRLGLGLG